MDWLLKVIEYVFKGFAVGLVIMAAIIVSTIFIIRLVREIRRLVNTATGVNWSTIGSVGGGIVAVLLLITTFLKLSAFWIYWLLILLVIIAIIVASIMYEIVRGYVGRLVGQLISNNNYRLAAIAVLAVIFSFSALLAGFGEPILISSGRDAVAPIVEKAEQNSAFKQEVNYLLWGERKIESIQQPASSKQKYHSWWHWIIAFLLWLATIVYTPIALGDEAKDAWNSAKKMVEKRKKESVSTTGVAQTAVAPAVGEKAKTVFTGDWRNSFLRLFSIDILAEFVPMFLNKLIKTIFK